VSADPLVFAVGGDQVTSMLLSVAAGGGVDVVDVDPVDVVPDDTPAGAVLLDIESGGLVAPAAAFEALDVLVSLHPASRPVASSKQQTINSRAPITRPS
jgi:hypothetical protein